MSFSCEKILRCGSDTGKWMESGGARWTNHQWRSTIGMATNSGDLVTTSAATKTMSTCSTSAPEHLGGTFFPFLIFHFMADGMTWDVKKHRPTSVSDRWVATGKRGTAPFSLTRLLYPPLLSQFLPCFQLYLFYKHIRIWFYLQQIFYSKTKVHGYWL